MSNVPMPQLGTDPRPRCHHPVSLTTRCASATLRYLPDRAEIGTVTNLGPRCFGTASGMPPVGVSSSHAHRAVNDQFRPAARTEFVA